MKSNIAVDRLLSEADRFTGLAKDLALQLLVNPQHTESDKARLAREHLVRADTFKAAVAIIKLPNA